MSAVHTFGCRLNINESAAIEAALAGRDDVIVVNTCAVTSEATRQARQAIRRLSRAEPGKRLVVTGCAAQIEPERFAAMPEVTQVLGNAEKLDPRSWRRDVEGDDRVKVADAMAAVSIATPPISRFAGRVRGFVQVQNGCDHRCTFCVIPFGRGNSRSLAPDAVIAQSRSLLEAGHGEIVLTGVDLTSYDSEDLRLGGLVRRILREIPDLPRLRISSIDSIEADDDLLRALAEEERLMPHLHLSLQAGDDLILKRMKRRHSRADAVAFCAEARRLRPGIVFGADIIAGFPTETDGMFAASLDLINACGLSFVHAFPYSSRPGTPAARMPQLDGALIRDRAARLRAAGDAALLAFLDSQIGATCRALVEHGGLARSEHFAPLQLSAPRSPGEIADFIVRERLGRVLLADAA